MKLFALLGAGALVAGSLGGAVPADAQHYGYHHDHGYRGGYRYHPYRPDFRRYGYRHRWHGYRCPYRYRRCY